MNRSHKNGFQSNSAGGRRGRPRRRQSSSSRHGGTPESLQLSTCQLSMCAEEMLQICFRLRERESLDPSIEEVLLGICKDLRSVRINLAQWSQEKAGGQTDAEKRCQTHSHEPSSDAAWNRSEKLAVWNKDLWGRPRGKCNECGLCCAGFLAYRNPPLRRVLCLYCGCSPAMHDLVPAKIAGAPGGSRGPH